MNAIIENMKTRRSIRGYKPDRMPARELIEQVIEAGTYAPTGRGMQSPVIVAVTNKAVRDRLSKLNAEVLGTTSDSLRWFIGDGKPDECGTRRRLGKLLDSPCQRSIQFARRQRAIEKVGD